jgi:acyl-CoA thioesterase
MTALSHLLDTLELEQTGPTSYRASSMTEGPGQVVFGGQLLAQSIVAATKAVPDKEVKSLHTIFARGASNELPLDIELDVIQQGRAFASVAITFRQNDKNCVRSTAFLHAPDPDLIRYAAPRPDVGSPDAAAARPGFDWWEVRFVDDVDIDDPALVGPPELDVWTRFPDAPADPVVNQALLGYATDGFLIATAMRPHEGVGQSLAHTAISTTVLTHTLTFHEPVDASSWLLLTNSSPYAGRGRSYGRADVFSEQGALVASYVQENMIRDFPKGQAPAAGERSKT